MKKNKLLNLDMMRLFAAFMIVAIHTYPFTSYGETLDYLITRVIFRVAVPLYLIVTGYFVLPKSIEDTNIIKSYTFKILKIYVLSVFIYLPINIYIGYFDKFSLLNLLKDLIFNGTFYHLWYFPASIAGLWITYFLIKNFKKKNIIFLMIILYLIGLLGDSYYRIGILIPIFNNIIDFILTIFDYTRNGIFYVPIFLYMGYLIKTETIKYDKKRNNSLIIIYLILMTIEGFILYKFNIPRHSSMYLFLIPLMYHLFILFFKISNSSNQKVRTFATWIYIIHPLTITVIHFICNKLNLLFILDNSFINYLAILFSTILLVYLGTKTVNLFSKKIKT